MACPDCACDRRSGRLVGVRGPLLKHPAIGAGQIASFTDTASSGCDVLSIDGTRLIVESTRDFALGLAVKVSSQNHLWIGEVWACEPVENHFRLEIEVDARLNNVSGVDELAARFRHERAIRTSDAFGIGKP